MKERRASIRLKKNVKGILFFNDTEFEVTIVDISESGIAFESKKDLIIPIGTDISISVDDSFVKDNEDVEVFSGVIAGDIRNINYLDNGFIRYGCFVGDKNYSEYVRAQLISCVCGTYSIA